MLVNFLKKAFYNSPDWIKKIYGALPYRVKFGNTYYNELKLIKRSYHWGKEEYNEYLNKTLVSLVNYAYQNIEFYRKLYDEHGIDIKQIQNKTDFERLPTVTKKMLREAGDDTVSSKVNSLNSIRANTGGSSGEPFSFLLPKNQYYRAWAYKADMWGRAGYKVGNAVLSLRGHQHKNKLYEHQPIYNFYYVDSYQLNADNVYYLVSLIQKKNINFIHGYPSNIVRFIELLEEPSNLSIKGILPCSEKVDPQSKKIIKNAFKAKIQPSYEQSEMTILASYGENSDQYYFYPTYGYPELVTQEGQAIHSDNKKGKLIGTTFSNKIMPLIRYETGDEAIWTKGEEERLQNFKCAEEIVGRVGEYIITDEDKVSVTGLIYGQHLPIFDISNQIQLYQKNSSIILFYVLNGNTENEQIIEATRKQLFESLNGGFDIKLMPIRKPFKTKSGKKKILLGEQHQKRIDRLLEEREG
jgi:phenylacetate-CoA ligase